MKRQVRKRPRQYARNGAANLQKSVGNLQKCVGKLQKCVGKLQKWTGNIADSFLQLTIQVYRRIKLNIHNKIILIMKNPQDNNPKNGQNSKKIYYLSYLLPLHKAFPRRPN